MQIERIPITIDERFAEGGTIATHSDKNTALILASILLFAIASILALEVLRKENKAILSNKKQSDERE